MNGVLSGLDLAFGACQTRNAVWGVTRYRVGDRRGGYRLCYWGGFVFCVDDLGGPFEIHM
jgi:hypothetical protein